MRRVCRLAFCIDVNGHRAGSGAQDNLVAGRRCTSRNSHALAGQRQNKRQQK